MIPASSFTAQNSWYLPGIFFPLLRRKHAHKTWGASLSGELWPPNPGSLDWSSRNWKLISFAPQFFSSHSVCCWPWWDSSKSEFFLFLPNIQNLALLISKRCSCWVRVLEKNLLQESVVPQRFLSRPSLRISVLREHHSPSQTEQLHSYQKSWS